MMGKKIAIDLDEVLGGFVDALAEFHNNRYGGNLTRADFDTYTFRDVWGGTEEESVEKVKLFFESVYFDGIKTVAGAVDGVAQLKACGFDLAVVTSRQLMIEDKTRAWIDRYFPGMFDQIEFGNTWGTEGRKRSKPDLCQELGAVMMIDDSLLYATQCSEAGVPTLLFDLDGSYRWNQTNRDLGPMIRRATSWYQVVDLACAMLM